MTVEATAPRVALLARPGAACDRLRGALDDAGAQRVLEADPTGLDVAALLEAQPQVVLIALDPVTEDALERFDAVLGDPAIDVIFEEADLVAAREGWDAARWQRHLFAKLHRHDNVLPPGPEPVADAVAPGGLEGLSLAPESEAGEPVAVDDTGPSYNPFDPVEAETLDWSGARPDSTPAGAGDFTFAFDPVAAESADFGLAGEPASGQTSDPVTGLELTLDGDSIEAPASPVSPASAAGFGELSLDDGSGPIGQVDPATDDRFKRDLSALDQRISSLQLVDDTPARGPEQPRGAVLILAGIGGPDAVRQLLGALPVDFPRPVLVQQRLDGGRHDKLVAQMQRATTLPVRLAEPGQSIDAGTIYILPGEVGLDAGDDGLRFNDTGGDVLAALPAADSAVLLLSGSDAAVVDAAMNHSWSGALVAGQSADGCYDAAAPSALAARGGEAGTPAELAQRLAERWPAGGQDPL